jgi:hypothetical protein
VTHTIEQIRERGVPGFEVEVVGTDPGVDRRLPAATSLHGPFYEGMTLGRARASPIWPRRWPRVATTSSTSPPLARPASPLAAQPRLGDPLLASYHTELAVYAGVRSGDGGLEAISRAALAAFYTAPSLVLSPSPAADRSLLGLGAEERRIDRWERGVDVSRFSPRSPIRMPGRASCESSTRAG